jgi:hypothetical protein
LLYVLESTLMLESGGQQPMTLKAGEHSHMPATHIPDVRASWVPVSVIITLALTARSSRM